MACIIVSVQATKSIVSKRLSWDFCFSMPNRFVNFGYLGRVYSKEQKFKLIQVFYGSVNFFRICPDGLSPSNDSFVNFNSSVKWRLKRAAK